MPRSVLLVVFAVTLLGAGCSGEQTTPPAKSPPPPAPSPSAEAEPLLTKYPRAELARRPCRALDARDLPALGITGKGKEEKSKNGTACHWKLDGQNVSLDLDVPQSQAKIFTTNGRLSQVPVGQHLAVQSEFQRICFIFVALDTVENLVGTTSIPEPGGSQEGTCPAGAAVAAAALTHIE
jgi:hypothetical protein